MIKRTSNYRTANLEVPINQDFLPVIISFTEKSAETFHLGEKEKFQLVLAADEVCTYLCQHSKSEDIIKIKCTDITYSIKLEFIFPVNDLNLKMFNITSRISPESKDDIEGMGLFIASRSVDRFHITNDHHGNIILTLYKDRIYPHIEEIIINKHEELAGEFTITEASPEDLTILLYKIANYYPPYLYPKNFCYPGKIADMMYEGMYNIYVVLDKFERVSGGLLWSTMSTLFIFPVLKQGCIIEKTNLPPCFRSFLKDITRGSSDAISIIAIVHTAPSKMLSPMLSNVFLSEASITV